MKDRQGKDIEGMMWMLGRLLLRHEDQMGIDKTENNFVMFFKKESALSLVPTFVKKAEHWHSLKEQKQAKMDELALPLRTFLFHSMLEALLLRLKETTQSQDQLSTAMTLQVFLPKEDNQDLLIPFLKFDPETKALTPLSDRQATTVTEMINKIQELQKLCLCQLAVLRFHSTQKLQGPLQGPTVPFLLQVGSRTPQATQLYLLLRSMTQSAVWQLVGGSLRPERMGRSALAAELAKRLQGSRPQFHASSESAIVPITVMQTLLCDLVAGHACTHAANESQGTCSRSFPEGGAPLRVQVRSSFSGPVQPGWKRSDTSDTGLQRTAVDIWGRISRKRRSRWQHECRATRSWRGAMPREGRIEYPRSRHASHGRGVARSIRFRYSWRSVLHLTSAEGEEAYGVKTSPSKRQVGTCSAFGCADSVGGPSAAMKTPAGKAKGNTLEGLRHIVED
eukprot:s1365_g4.t1